MLEGRKEEGLKRVGGRIQFLLPPRRARRAESTVSPILMYLLSSLPLALLFILFGRSCLHLYHITASSEESFGKERVDRPRHTGPQPWSPYSFTLSQHHAALRRWARSGVRAQVTNDKHPFRTSLHFINSRVSH